MDFLLKSVFPCDGFASSSLQFFWVTPSWAFSFTAGESFRSPRSQEATGSFSAFLSGLLLRLIGPYSRFHVSPAAINVSLCRTHGFVSRWRGVLLALLHVFRCEYLWDLARLAI